MDDNKIIELFFARDERAIEETKTSYGRLLFSVARNILGNAGESEECENDTYLRAWGSIPPARPTSLSAYLTRITRNLALNRLRSRHSGSIQAALILDEISEVIPEAEGDPTEEIELREAIKCFVEGLDSERRNIFLKRYYYMLSVNEIASEMGMRVGTVKSTLHRTRKSLLEHLTKRGIYV